VRFVGSIQAEALEPGLTVLETLERAAPDSEMKDFKALLGRMMFSGKAMHKKVCRRPAFQGLNPHTPGAASAHRQSTGRRAISLGVAVIEDVSKEPIPPSPFFGTSCCGSASGHGLFRTSRHCSASWCRVSLGF
jgi:hypothetical protein